MSPKYGDVHAYNLKLHESNVRRTLVRTLVGRMENQLAKKQPKAVHGQVAIAPDGIHYITREPGDKDLQPSIANEELYSQKSPIPEDIVQKYVSTLTRVTLDEKEPGTK